jgi:hypothetical protein
MKKLLFSAALALCSLSAFAQSAAGEKYDPIRVCVIQDNELKEILAFSDKNTGKIYVDRDGKLITLAEAFPVENGYAANKTWFINNEKITVNGKTYVKYGLPRILGIGEIEKAGTYDNVGIYAEAGAGGMEVVYIPVEPGCEFQPYQVEVKTPKVEQSKKAPKMPKKEGKK